MCPDILRRYINVSPFSWGAASLTIFQGRWSCCNAGSFVIFWVAGGGGGGGQFFWWGREGGCDPHKNNGHQISKEINYKIITFVSSSINLLNMLNLRDKNNKNNTGNCKALCVSHKHKKGNRKKYIFAEHTCHHVINLFVISYRKNCCCYLLLEFDQCTQLSSLYIAV